MRVLLLKLLKSYSKKHDKKVMALRVGSGWGDPIGRLGRATSHVFLAVYFGRPTDPPY